MKYKEATDYIRKILLIPFCLLVEEYLRAFGCSSILPSLFSTYRNLKGSSAQFLPFSKANNKISHDKKTVTLVSKLLLTWLQHNPFSPLYNLITGPFKGILKDEWTWAISVKDLPSNHCKTHGFLPPQRFGCSPLMAQTRIKEGENMYFIRKRSWQEVSCELCLQMDVQGQILLQTTVH